MARLQHKRGRKSSYVRKLQTDEWREVCRLVRIRDGHRCRRCGKNYTLEVHHLRYYVCGRSIVGNERQHLDCLVTLCAACHQAAHGRKPCET